MRSRNNQFKMSARAFNIGFCGCNANGPRELSINTAKQIQMQAPYFVEVLGINEQVWTKQDRKSRSSKVDGMDFSVVLLSTFGILINFRYFN